MVFVLYSSNSCPLAKSISTVFVQEIITVWLFRLHNCIKVLKICAREEFYCSFSLLCHWLHRTNLLHHKVYFSFISLKCFFFNYCKKKKKFLVLVVDASEPPPSVNDGGHRDTNQTGHHSGIHVFIADFSRVQIPFIISAWILSASIAKIGNISCFILKSYLQFYTFYKNNQIFLLPFFITLKDSQKPYKAQYKTVILFTTRLQ